MNLKTIRIELSPAEIQRILSITLDDDKEDNMNNKEILKNAFHFHGHICWASAAGTRAGIIALRELGVKRTGSSGELHCILEIGENHGAQCFADGVQFSTGCTIGKGNIEKAGWGKLAITLIDKKNQKAVRVSYKNGLHHKKNRRIQLHEKTGPGHPAHGNPGAGSLGHGGHHLAKP